MSNAGAGMPSATLVPTELITGFLGSGKTTLLNGLLAHPEMRDTAVIVNEFGEVGLDHLLIDTAFEDAVLLRSGCICCTVRGDLVDTMTTLLERRDRGEVGGVPGGEDEGRLEAAERGQFALQFGVQFGRPGDQP